MGIGKIDECSRNVETTFSGLEKGTQEIENSDIDMKREINLKKRKKEREARTTDTENGRNRCKLT